MSGDPSTRSDGSHESSASLRQLQRLSVAGHLACGIAHDFNNTLQLIGASLGMIASSPRDGALVREQIELALDALTHATGIARQLASFGRPDAGTREPVELGKLLVSATRLVRPVILSSIEIAVTDASEPLQVWADSGQIQQAVVNLCLNARDAMMPNGGVLRVGAARAEAERFPPALALSGDYAVIAVSDTGTGIPDDIRPRVFEPFFTTRKGDEGSGLGLSMVSAIARGHDGHVEFDSSPRGTTVQLFLPLCSSRSSEK